MPTSPWQPIGPIIDLIMDIEPRPDRILDVGLGFGKWGMLLREYLEYYGRSSTLAGTRLIVIDGIEVCASYVGTIQKAIYDTVFLGDARAVLPELVTCSYDLVMLIDVIEHFDKVEGKDVLAECVRVGEVVIVSTASGWYPQKAAHGNIYETHRSLWTVTDLRRAKARFVTQAGN